MNIPFIALNILEPLYSIFGWVLRALYLVFNNYGVALIIFTVVIRLVLLPFSVKNHKSSLQQRALQPKLKELQKYYGDDKEGMGQAQMELYNKHNVSMAGGCLSSILQLLVMWPIFRVLQGPLHYVMGVTVENLEIIGQRLVDAGTLVSAQIADVQRNSIPIIEGLRSAPTVLSNVINDGLLSLEQLIDLDFLGINLGLTPTINFDQLFGAEMSTYLPLLLFPILVVVTSWISMQFSQRVMQGNNKESKEERQAKKDKVKNNPALQDDTVQDTAAQSSKTMMMIMPIMMLFFTFNAPVAMSLYYIISNLIAIFQVWLFETIYTKPMVARQAESDAEWDAKIAERSMKEKERLEELKAKESKKKRRRRTN